MFIYLDTSAPVKLYVEEEEGRELVKEALNRADLVATSTVASAEARSALARKQREDVFTEEALRDAVSDLDRDWEGFLSLPVSNLLARETGEMAERHALRGFDAIHRERETPRRETRRPPLPCLRRPSHRRREGCFDLGVRGKVSLFRPRKSYFRRAEYPPNG